MHWGLWLVVGVFFLACWRAGWLWLVARSRGIVGEKGGSGRARRARVLLALSVVLGAGVWLLWGTVWGLGGMVFVPSAQALWQRREDARRAREMEASGIGFFLALRGMVHAGWDLSTALFHLAQTQDTTFARAVAGALEGFESGRPLPGCLTRIERRAGGALLGLCLRSLKMAYSQGFAAGALLDAMVPLLESERQMRERLADLRRGAMAQAVVACSVPWGILALLAGVQPGVAHRLCEPGGLLVLCGVVLWEAGGVWCLRTLSRFA